MELFLFIIILDGECFFKKDAVHITYIENPPYILCLPILRHKFCFSLTSTYKFDGAEGNLKKLLEKSHSTSNESKKMIANLMILIKDLLFEDSTKNLSDVSAI